MSENTNINNIENKKAKFAYMCAEQANKLSKPSEYRAYVKNIPMYIKSNGLGSTYAFIKSKSNKPAYDLIYNQTEEWLTDSEIPKSFNINDSEDLINEIISKNSLEYKAITMEVLSLFVWLRRFAEGLIEGED